jgi:hypothetical protein
MAHLGTGISSEHFPFVAGLRRASLPGTTIVTLYCAVNIFIMRSTIIVGLSSIVSGAAIERRDPVPAGYVAEPYYPSKFHVVMSRTRSLRK